MSAPVRRAGQALLDDGTELVWSVADGRRGRRWRATTIRDGRLESSLLLEVDVDGRPARLELTTPAGLLTLHPEATGALHGNAVTVGGLRHLTLAWSGEHALEIDGSSIPGVVTASRLAGTIRVGEGRALPAVVVGPDLTVRAGERRYERLDARSWRIEGEGRARMLAVDDRGLPIWPATTVEEWPLELDEHQGKR